MNDTPNDEISELIKAIRSSPHAQQALQIMYQEAEATSSNRGELLKSMWEKDASDMDRLYKDQQSNGMLRWTYLKILIAIYLFSHEKL